MHFDQRHALEKYAISCMLQSKYVYFTYVFFTSMFKSSQVVSDLLMVSSEHSSWTGNLLSLWQMRIIFLSPHSAIVTSSCMLTHVMVMTIPPNGLNLMFPIIAIWLLFPAPTCCSITRSFGRHQPSVISAAPHLMGPCLVYKNSISKNTMN
jgi:hypothetical protein